MSVISLVLLVRAALHDADVADAAVAICPVHSVAHHELVRALEAHEVEANAHGAALDLVQQAARAHGLGAAVMHELLEAGKRAARVAHLVYQQHVLAYLVHLTYLDYMLIDRKQVAQIQVWTLHGMDCTSALKLTV